MNRTHNDVAGALGFGRKELEDKMSTEQKHTPGPWEWLEDSNNHIDLIHSQEPNFHTGERFTVGILGVRQEPDLDETFDPQSPDARLIAAAPDLLEACIEAHARGAHGVGSPHAPGSKPDICWLCAAIAKATA